MREACFWYWHARSALAWGLAVAVGCFFAVSDEDFSNEANLYALTQIFVPLTLVAAGLAVVMIAGQFDLSIAGTFPLASLVVVALMDDWGVVNALVVAALIGVAVGVLNGLLVGVIRIPSLAVTVATMVLTIGFGYLVTGNEVVKTSNFGASLMIGKRVLIVFSLMGIIELLIVLAIWAAVTWTWFGRYLYAIGGDESRARGTKLPVSLSLVVAFAICALAATIAGGFQGILLSSGQAGVEETILLQGATAALIGGVAVRGGRGRLGGVVGAAALLAVLNNGLSLAGTSAPAIQFANGLILIAVVVLDVPLTRLLTRIQPQESAAPQAVAQSASR